MKKIIVIVILCVAGVISCTPQKQTASESSSETVKDSTCCFDIKKYNERRIKSGHYDFEYTENGKTIRQRYSLPERDSPESEGEYIEEISEQWSPFIIRKKYDYMGRMIRWSTTFRLESINKSYEYNENGDVIKITDYEERYKHSFADIRDFLLKQKGIDIYDTRQAIARRVNHQSKINPDAYYDIYILGKDDIANGYYIFINDITLAINERK